MADETAELPAAVAGWADAIAGMGGEENEHTLYFDPENVDESGMFQVWDDEADADGRPLVGFFALDRRFNIEFRWDGSPDEALELAAFLIVHADQARAMALVRAEDDADGI